MIKLNDKESQLFLTIRGNTPIDFSYQTSNAFNISNKLAFLYPNITRINSITHDIIRLIQKLPIESHILTQLILTLNYYSNDKNRDMALDLFNEAYFLIQRFSLDFRDGKHYVNEKEFILDRSLMISPEPTMTEELNHFSITEGVNFIKLYSYGSERRKKGEFLLFKRYLEENPKLLFGDLLFIQENFSYFYKDIDLSLIDNVTQENPLFLTRHGSSEFICFRKPGECTQWGLPYIEVSFSYKKNGNLFDLRYVEHTSGDDYTQGFWKNKLDKDDLNYLIDSVISPYLDDCKVTGMKDSTNFKKYFLENGINEDDLDFN